MSSMSVSFRRLLESADFPGFMKTLGYYNGKFGPLEEMTVPMNDRACYFGDGVYEATLARNGKIFALKEHLDRFFNSAGLIKIDIPYTKDELAAILYDMLAKMEQEESKGKRKDFS